MMTVGNELRIKSPFALLMALFPIFVLLFLEPFSIKMVGFQPIFALLLAGYGIIGALFVFFNTYWILPIILKKIQQWWLKIALEITWHLLTIAIGTSLYSHLLHYYFPQFHFPAFSYAEALEKTFLLGLMPLGLIVFFQHLQVRKKQKQYEDSLICLSAQDQDDWFKIEFQHLLFLEVADNYTCVYYVVKDSLQRKLLRGSLKHFEEQLKDLPVLRCHQSYIVNLTQVRFVGGNNRGLKLYLRHHDEAIPVSRKYSNDISSTLHKLNNRKSDKRNQPKNDAPITIQQSLD
ncbi:MAG: LytTR family DNA-binding domain-containing protein [Haliscomenobacter sp.]|uniref:LytTR family DNA-binding domain-containing protein n=1 Tax=Haliscomenobacter sp. TaxID=2717303 RepID=UPI0029B3B4DF|nr:LytTR family DNA-binding domain-containing protein [Haliscomenobacter sp.]MDX2068764.1 LytTR family DNA-binding domain-containing protein [Haliscomenobacter sp.]